MATQVRKRSSQSHKIEIMSEKTSNFSNESQLAEEKKHHGVVQFIRMLIFTSWFLCCCTCIHITQWIGAPLYFINQDYYYAYMALTKQSFGIVIATITQWFCPSVIRISWTPDLDQEFEQMEDGRLETRFPERMVMIANHQIYTDWLYLWWIAYTSKMHGHIYIILKEVYKYVPVLGPGMMFYGFIFMARKWASDEPRLKHRLQKLNSSHHGPLSGSARLDPMWLLIYPEGTNLSGNTRKGSVRWSEKSGIRDMKHQLLPRSTGLYFALQQLKETVEWVYDCTVAYEGTPKDAYAQDVFGLRTTFFEGLPPKSVNMHWRRFRVSEIPLDHQKAFESWLLERWREKDEYLQRFVDTGRLPATVSHDKATGGLRTEKYIETEVRLKSPFEIARIFVTLVAFALVVNVFVKIYEMFF